MTEIHTRIDLETDGLVEFGPEGTPLKEDNDRKQTHSSQNTLHKDSNSTKGLNWGLQLWGALSSCKIQRDVWNL